LKDCFIILVNFILKIEIETENTINEEENIIDGWPLKGEIEFDNFYIKYRKNLPNVKKF
jgi:hypothetical protein